jgi:hypothetical protein
MVKPGLRVADCRRSLQELSKRGLDRVIGFVFGSASESDKPNRADL